MVIYFEDVDIEEQYKASFSDILDTSVQYDSVSFVGCIKFNTADEALQKLATILSITKWHLRNDGDWILGRWC